MQSDPRGEQRRKGHLCFTHWLLLAKVTWNEMTDLEVGIQPSMQPRQAVLETARLCPRCCSSDNPQVPGPEELGRHGLVSNGPMATTAVRSSGNWPVPSATAGYGDPSTHSRPTVGKGRMIVGAAVFAGAVVVMAGMLLHSLSAGAAATPDGQAQSSARPGIAAEPVTDVYVDELQKGDCLARSIPVGDVSTSKVAACDQPHLEEVYAVFNLPQSHFTGQENVDQRGDAGCRKRFRSYVGIDYVASHFDYFALTPDVSTLFEDREVECILIAARHTGTLEGARR